jgi:hypothetical protein
MPVVSSVRRAATALALTLTLPLAACSTRAPEPVGGSAEQSSPSTAGSSEAVSAATAEVTGSASPTGTSGTGTGGVAQTCALALGPLLRERTTVTAAGVVTVLPGPLPCPAVGVWTGTFVLDEDGAGDPAPRFAGRYTGAAALTARLPAAGGRCGAAAVFFSVEAGDAARTAEAGTARQAVRTDLAYWPTGQSATVPAGVILQGRASTVLAATVAGDPSRCSPGESVATPFAAVGDCWLPGRSSGGGASEPAGGTGFRKTVCTGAHTHEVYWAETLTPQNYRAQTQGQNVSASAWAHKRASDVCAARGAGLRLADDVRSTDVFLELLWPSSLSYPPGGASGWSKAQIVCLVRWKDSRSSAQQLLRR